MRNVYDINNEFELQLSRYTGAPYVVTLQCCSNAIFLALKWCVKQEEIPIGYVVSIPSHTYPSVPCEIIHNSLRVHFLPSSEYLTGEYNLGGTRVWDSALTFRKGMYVPGRIQCVSFNARKHLKLATGGAILTDSEELYQWARKMRFSGRNEIDYLIDTLTEVGYRMYLIPEVAASGLKLLAALPDDNLDITLKYLDLSIQPAFKPFTV